MIEPVTSSLLATAIGKSASKAYSEISVRTKNNPYDVFVSEFQDSLQTELGDQFEEAEDHQFDSINGHTPFEDLQQASKQVSAELANSIDELSQDKAEVAVSNATQSALGAFLDRASDDDVTDRIQVEADIKISSQLKNARDELENLRQHLQSPQYFSAFSPVQTDKIREEIYNRGGIETEPNYVDRQEISQVNRVERLLLVGRKGSGKTRSLAELAETACLKSDIDRVIIPSDGFTQPEDLNPLLNSEFTGDILLVWDDIHDVSPIDDNQVFRESILKLEEKVDNLRVLATARAEDRDSLPNYEKQDDRLWQQFDEIELQPLEEDLVNMLIQSGLTAFDLDASYQVRRSFAERVLETDPSPFYIFSVLAIAAEENDELSVELVSNLPENAMKIWEGQYDELKRDSKEQRYVLRSIKILSVLNVPAYTKLAKGIFSEVFGQSQHEFEPAVEQLIASQWVGKSTTEENGEGYFRIHDIQIESVEGLRQSDLQLLSDFVEDPIGWSLPEADSVHARLNNNFAAYLSGRYPIEERQLIEKHYRRAEKLDSEYIQPKINLGDYFTRIGDYGASEEVLQEALQSNPHHPQVNASYGRLLSNRGDLHEANKFIDKALELNPNLPLAHHDKAELLVHFDDLQSAKQHIESALKLDPYSPESRNSYGNTLRDLGYIEEAEKQFQYAIKLDSSYGSPYVNLGLTYQKQGDLDKAEKCLNKGVEVSSGDRQIQAINNLATLFIQKGEPERAVKFLEGDLQSSDDPRLQNTVGSIFSSTENFRKAASAYQRALSENPRYETPKKNLVNIYQNQDVSPPDKDLLTDTEHPTGQELAMQEVRLRYLLSVREYDEVVNEAQTVLNGVAFDQLAEELSPFEEVISDLYLAALEQKPR